MYRKYCIVLFVTIFYNGVAYSSPTTGSIQEVKEVVKEAAPVAVPSQINHKVEPTALVPQSETHHAETSTVKTSSNHSGDGTLKNSSVVDPKIISQGSANVSASDNKNLKPVTSNSSTVSRPAGDTSHTPTPLTDNKPTTNDAHRNDSEMPRPTSAGQTTTLVTTPAGQSTTTRVSTLAPGTTHEAPVTKPATVVTPTPAVTNTTDGVHVEHNSPSQSQGNRFDGASFVGGIVLTIGLTAIGFIAFKYYKSGKIDGNYRTL